MPYGVSSGESDRLDGDLEAELSNAGFFADPYPTFARIRGRQPVAWSTTYNSWLVTRYEDVRVGLDDPRLSSDRMGALLGQLPEKSDASARVVLDHYDNMFSMAGEPQHSEDKTIVTKCFQRAQRSIDDLQASIESLVLQAVNETVRDGVVDFASSVASNIPISIIGLLLGVPESERAQLVPWTEDIFNVMASGQAIPEVVEQGARSLAAMYEYIDTLIAERVARPTDDLLGMLVSSSRGSAVFGDGRLKASIVSFFTAGHETSCAQIESSLIHLLRDNDRLEDLRAAGG